MIVYTRYNFLYERWSCIKKTHDIQIMKLRTSPENTDATVNNVCSSYYAYIC